MQTGRSKDDGDKAAGTGKPATGSASQNDKPSADKAQTDRPKSPSTLEKAIARDAQERNGDGPKSGDSGPDAGTQSSGTEGGKGTPPSSHGRLYGIVGVLVLFLVLAAAYIAWPLWGPALPGWMRASLAPVMEAGRGAGAGRQVDALAAKVAGLEQDVAAIRSQLAAQPKADPAKLSSLDDAVQSNAGRIKALQDDVAALRQKLPEAGQSDKLAALTRRVAEAESRIAALAAEPGTKAAVEALDSLRTQSSARMTVLERENDALHKLIAAQEKRLAALEKRPSTVAGTTRANALVIAVGQLREEVRGTAPFASALDAVQALATGDAALQPEIDALTPPSKTGVPDLAALRLHFERIARRIASEAYVPKGKGWLDKTLQQISRLVTVRRSGPEAATRDDENGRVARAELRLAAGDLSGAVAALDGLSGTAANIAAPWLKDARARLAVNRAVDRLFSEALRRTAAAGKDTIGG